MMRFRSATTKDLAGIHQLALQAGLGLTTLPKDKAILKKRLQLAVQSFKKNHHDAQDEYFLFVLENCETGELAGTAAIEASIGSDGTPFYSYKLSRRTRVSHALNIRSDYEVLSLVNDNQGKSELCTLFLAPAFRHNYNGTLLSRARFLFMAQFPERFSKAIIAEMRGVSFEDGHSPFWDNVGRHFFHMPFADADHLTMATNKQFIADLMPRSELYLKLLAPEAQAVIGKPHPSTVPAMKILLKEGFRYEHYIDIFDAGPTLEAPLREIRTIRASQLLQVQSLSDEVSSGNYLISNTSMDFKAVVNKCIAQPGRRVCIISKKTAKALGVKCGDYVRIAPLKLQQEEVNYE